MTSLVVGEQFTRLSLKPQTRHLQIRILNATISRRQYAVNIDSSPCISNDSDHIVAQQTYSHQESTSSKHTMSTSRNKQVLVMGIKYGPGQDPAAWSAEQVLKDFKSQIDEAKEAGFDLEVYPVDTTVSHDEVLGDVQALLKKHHWDGIAIGFGLRGNESLTPLFEKLVNMTVEQVQPYPKFAFPLRPHIVWEAVSRVFGVQAK